MINKHLEKAATAIADMYEGRRVPPDEFEINRALEDVKVRLWEILQQ